MKYIEKARNPEFWRAVREKECYRAFLEKYLERWEAECENTYPNTLRYSDWAEFHKSGKRIEFNYFQARQQLMAAAFLSLIYPEEEKYLKRVQDQLYLICNEYTWCVPAHFGKDMTAAPKRKIDLFCAETALALAEIYVILEERLDDFIKMRVREELLERIVNAMAEVPEFGFERMSNNWSSVCTFNVGGTIMLMFPERFAEFKPRFDAAMALYLTGYHDDGVCLEGASYWSYGFGSYIYYADMLRDFTGEDLFSIPKVKNIATFMQKTFLTGSACVSFSDGGRSASFGVGLLHYLKGLFPEDVVLMKSEFKGGRDGCARFSPALRTVLFFNEEMYENPEESSANVTFFGEGAQWYIRRLPSYGFAAKGGHNREPHNHLDVGSFIFAKDGEQVLMDLGPGAYTKQYFSGERYNTFQAHSRSHSVPIIGEEGYQRPGAGYRAKNMTATAEGVSLDIAGAYGIDELSSLVRSFEIGERGIRMTDEIAYTGEGCVTERFVTLHEPRLAEGRVLIQSSVMSFDESVATPVISTEELSNGSTCYLIDFKLPKGTQRFTISVE